jgi:hypothetical protein
MIVNQTQAGWEVIYQPAHALLAAEIAAHWRTDQRPQRWVETLVALAQHDDEARDWTQRAHLTDSGAPLDFSLHKTPSLIQPSQVTQDLQYKGQWAALLISMHMIFLYGHLRDTSAEFETFIQEQLDHQKCWREALGVSQAEADKAYALFQWCDRMSLILCRHELPEAERALEVSDGPDGTHYEVRYCDNRVIIQPWPFAEPQFSVYVEAIMLSQLSFKDDAELQSALKAEPITYLSWAF